MSVVVQEEGVRTKKRRRSRGGEGRVDLKLEKQRWKKGIWSGGRGEVGMVVDIEG